MPLITSLNSFFHFNSAAFLLAAGYIGLFAGVFAETGFLIGLFLPGGETLIFTAAVLASIGYFNIWIVALISFLAAVFADSVEYGFGRRYGPRVFTKEGSRWLDRSYIDRSKEFFDRHGPKTIIISRFLPFIRTLAPAFAGVGKMSYPRFALYNIAGAALWVAVASAMGYWLGMVFPNAEQYIAGFVIVVAIASIFTSWLMVHRHRKRTP